MSEYQNIEIQEIIKIIDDNTTNTGILEIESAAMEVGDFLFNRNVSYGDSFILLCDVFVKNLEYLNKLSFFLSIFNTLVINQIKSLEENKKIKNCPFCDSPGVIEDLSIISNKKEEGYRVFCYCCCAQIPNVFKNKGSAISAWNERNGVN